MAGVQKNKRPMPGATAVNLSPPRDETPARELRPPNIRERLLPLADIGSRKFEELCLDIIEVAFPEVKSSALKRRSGVKQYGVDVEGLDDAFQPTVVISAKCYHDIKAWHFRGWIEDFTEHLETHWKDKGIKKFVLAISHEANDDDMNDQGRAIVAALRKIGIQFILWNASTISKLVSSDVQLVRRYFNQYWVDAISAPYEISPKSTAFSPANRGVAMATEFLLQQVTNATAMAAAQIDNAQAGRLDDALKALRAGNATDLRSWFERARADQEIWTALAPETQAKSLRATAMLSLRTDDIAVAKSYLDEADGLSAPIDRSLRAALARSEQDLATALRLLENPATDQEKELKAGILIETDHPRQALELLSVEEGPATSEADRLRAIASFLIGERHAALQFAIAAAAGEPGAFLPKFTLATIRLMTSLAHGPRPCFGYAPDPINPGLVKLGRDNLVLLHQAAADFEALLPNVTDVLHSDIEVWKLAALLLNPERFTDAERFARELSGRDEINPMAVAWLRSSGLLRNAGQVRKALGDSIRAGRGSPTHLAVFALLVAGDKHPERGLAALRKYEHLYPNARNFINDWQVQFGDGQITPVARNSVHRFLQAKDYAGAVSFIEASSSSVDDMLGTAEHLLWRSAWPELDRLGPKLVEMGTERSLQLAAVAALRNDRPDACLSILLTVENLSGDHGLPIAMRQLRIDANLVLGRNRAIIDEVRSIPNERRSPIFQQRLMDAYHQIGALHEFEREAKWLLQSDNLRPEGAVKIAQVLRDHAPHTARTALIQALDRGIDPKFAGTALFLASHLGLPDQYHSPLMQMMLAPNSGAQVQTFQTVEEIISFLQVRSQEYRDRLQQWYAGKMPACIAFATDKLAFARLFLSPASERKTHLGDPFPMLLLSGRSHSAHVAIPDGRPVIRIDLSALMLAARLDLLPDLERAFCIEIARSAVAFFLDVEAELAQINAEVIETCRRYLAGSSSELQLHDELPHDAVLLHIDTNEEKANIAVAQCLETVFRAGHLDEHQLKQALASLRVERAGATLSATAVWLSEAALIRLAALGVLGPLAETFQLRMTVETASDCLGDLDAASQAIRLRETIAKLRNMISAKLSSGAWTLAPLVPSVAAEDHALKPPHVRCLVEMLAVHTYSPDLIWIEDRAISRAQMEGTLGVFDIVEHLRTQGFISTGRRDDAVHALRTAGYAYFPIDSAEIRRLVVGAPLGPFGLVETPQLGTLRIWFAREAALIRHLDRELRQGPNGELVGEAKQLVDIAGLAKTIISAIWTDCSISAEEKQFRSSWVWVCLRVERLIGLPSDETADSRSFQSSQTLAHTLCGPLLWELSGVDLSAEDQKLFIDWFWGFHVGTFIRADPKALDRIADVVSAVIAGMLAEVDTSADDERRQYFQSLVRVAYDFICLLPDELRARVTGRNDLKAKLRIRTSEVLNFGDTIRIEVSALAEACVAAWQSTDAQGVASVGLASPDGKPVELELRWADEKLIQATIAAGDTPVLIGTRDIALLDPDEDRRLKTLPAVAAQFGKESAISISQMSDIAQLVSPTDRLAAVVELTLEDFHLFLTAVYAQSIEKGSVGRSSLDLPTPVSLLKYLRITDGETASVGEVISQSVGRMSQDLGVLSAATRACGMPALLPDDFLKEIGTQLSALPGGQKRLKPPSPLAAFCRLRALLAVDADDSRIAESLEDLVEAVNAQSSLFISILGYGSILANRSSEWRQLPKHIKLMLLWVYADSFTQLLVKIGVDLEKTAILLMSSSRPDLSDLEDRALDPYWLSRSTVKLDRFRLASAMVGQLMRDGYFKRLTPAQSASLKLLCGSEQDGVWAPCQAIIAPPGETPSGFWACSDDLAAMVEAGWLGADHPFAVRDIDAIIAVILDVGERTLAAHALQAFLVTIDMDHVSDESVEAVRKLLDREFGEDKFEPDQNGVARILAVRAIIYGRQNDADAMVKALSRQAARCAQKWPAQQRAFGDFSAASARILVMLVETAYGHVSLLPRSKRDRMEVFARCIASIVKSWSGARLRAISLLDSVVRHLDAEAASDIWPILMDIRGE